MSILKSLVLHFEKIMLGKHANSRLTTSTLRKAQIDRVISVNPLMVLVCYANAVSLIMHFWNTDLRNITIFFMAPILVLITHNAYAVHQFKLRKMPDYVGTTAIEKVTAYCSISALLWGSSLAVLFSSTSANPDFIVSAVIAGMLGGGAVAMSFVPSALLAFVTPIAILTTIAMFMYPTLDTVLLGILFLIYCFILVRAGMVFAKNLAKSVCKDLEQQKNADTISILLNEYAEGASDWLWEIDSSGKMTFGVENFSSAIGTDISSWHFKFDNVQKAFSNNKLFVQQNLEAIQEAFVERIPLQEITFGVGPNHQNMVWIEVSGKPQFDAEGSFMGYRGFAKNRTLEVEDQKNIQFLANNDTMTGLLNRSSFFSKIDQAFANYLESGSEFAILYIDLDGFKRINDTKGHATGDEVLVEVSKRLKSTIGKTAVIARLGGDEFAAMVEVDKATSKTEEIADAIIKTVAKPIQCRIQEVRVSASIGIAFIGKDGKDTQSVVSSADTALYQAKHAGKDCYRVFDTSMNEQVHRMNAMREALEKDLDNGALKLAFQPFFRSSDQSLAGFEALARWEHKDFGFVPPDVFIPLAEQTGLINKLGDWALREGCYIASYWPPHMKLAVNVSVPQFQQESFIERLENILDETKMEANRLELEITEAVFADNPEAVMEKVTKIKRLGVSFSLDDFGTGFSSLMYLIKFPFDKLKIDRSFLQQAERDESAKKVLQTIARLGEQLKMETTVEGIETAEQLSMVSELNCTYLQGYYFGKPQQVIDIGRFIARDVQRMLAEKSADNLIAFTPERKQAW
ncbi:bifunctional diguanylate cyclase/phosphodiesterase [Ahrensia sp. 13_GOM-1096m]|uniref:putative bifunctional diguanylate cyclase/phosphodiesterase n=1 Tax=Ahrensia sp. 13_GOM-1096m TaxID=1380380 RepID=UPI00047AA997|nr:EAL domain-containing protein [Ahrensia sp. 13_GOM-1096m]